jgi:hypothetical protein
MSFLIERNVVKEYNRYIKWLYGWFTIISDNKPIELNVYNRYMIYTLCIYLLQIYQW